MMPRLLGRTFRISACAAIMCSLLIGQDAVKAAIAEARELERRGDYAGALRILNDLEVTNSGKETQEALRDLDKAITSKYRTALDEAQRLFQQKKYAEADAKLEEGARFVPGSPTILYDKALILERTGRDQEAVALLRSVAETLAPSDLLDGINQKIAVLAAGHFPEVDRIRSTTRGFNDRLTEAEQAISRPGRGRLKRQIGRYVEVCTSIAEAAKIPNSEDLAALLYNRARCREYEGDISEAQHLLEEFLRKRQDSPITSIVQDRLDVLRAVATADLRARRAYGELINAVDTRDYRTVLEKSKELIEVAPEQAEFRWRLLVLQDALGNVQAVREAARAVLNGTDTEGRKKDARLLSDSIESRRALYEQSLGEADEEMEKLVISVAQKQKVHLPTRLDRIRRPLQTALEIFPLGPEANALMAMFLQHGSQQRLATRLWDVVLAFDHDVVFYAKAIAEDENRSPSSLARVRLNRSGIEIEPVGNMSDGKHPPLQARSVLWGRVTSVESESYLVRLRQGKRDLLLRPLDFNYGGFKYPGKGLLRQRGGVSRRFSNHYVRLFDHFGATGKIELATEHMSFGEIAFATAILGAVAVPTLGTGAVVAGGQLAQRVP